MPVRRCQQLSLPEADPGTQLLAILGIRHPKHLQGAGKVAGRAFMWEASRGWDLHPSRERPQAGRRITPQGPLT